MLEKLLEEIVEKLEENQESFYDEDGDWYDDGIRVNKVEGIIKEDE